MAEFNNDIIIMLDEEICPADDDHVLVEPTVHGIRVGLSKTGLAADVTRWIAGNVPRD
jgi:hypothetical protein